LIPAINKESLLMKLNDELDLKDETRLRTTGAVEWGSRIG